MKIMRSKFPNRVLILPNTRYFFGNTKAAENPFEIVRVFDCADIATVYISSLGTFGFIFPDSSDLASIDALKFRGQGLIPERVIENENEIQNLQTRRMLFINFVSAVFFGRIAAKASKILEGALYTGQDGVARFDIIQNAFSIQCTEKVGRIIKEKVDALNTEKHQSNFLNENDIDDAISYVQHVLARQNDFQYANLQSCIVMNYQAAILHKQQHFDASSTLNFVVIESLVREIFMAYGLVTNSTVKSFAARQHEIAKISKKKFDEMNLHEVTTTLRTGSLIDDDLFQRIDTVRKKRNKLMHKSVTISPKESGECQTVVRDLWSFLIDIPFELITSWSYIR
jgi:hypothetical protein